MTLQFISWEFFKFAVPLMYLAAIHIIVRSDNAMWMGGIGRNVYQYQHKLTDNGNLDNVTIKLCLMVLLDGILFVVEVFILRAQRIDLWGVLCYSCEEFGSTFCFLLAFMPLNQLCILAVACGMDFTFTFHWWSDGEGQYRTSYFKEINTVRG